MRWLCLNYLFLRQLEWIGASKKHHRSKRVTCLKSCSVGGSVFPSADAGR